MADLLDFAPVRVFTSNAAPGAGYIARFYQSGTTTPVTVFSNSALTTPLGSSVTADAEGKFVAVFSAGGAIKATIETPDGAIVATVDPVQSVPASASAAGVITFSPSPLRPFDNVQDAIDQGTFPKRTITAGAGVTVTNGDGEAGNPVISATPQRGYIFGLTLANNGTDANNDIDIAAGEASSDATTPVLMQLTSAITKRLDAAWAVGNNQGGLDTGTKAINTWYYLWLIRRPDTGVVDVLFSASATSPTLPANYTQRRRLPGAVRTDGSGNLRAFAMAGRSINWAAPVQDFSSATARTLSALTITVPPIVTRALVQVTVTSVSSAGFLFYQIGGSNVASPPTIQLGTSAGANTVSGSIDPPPLYAAAGQIMFGGGGTASTTAVFTIGFEDVTA